MGDQEGLLWGYIVINLSIINLLIDYLSEQWKEMDLMYLAAIVNAIEGLSGIMVLVFAFLADDIMGEYLMIIVSTVSYIIGLSLYLIYEEFLRPRMWTLIFLLSVPLLIIGEAGQYNVEEFFATQMIAWTDNNDKQKKEKRVRIGKEISFLFAVFGGILLVSIYLANATWGRVFLSAILILVVALLLFSVMKTIYIFKEEPESPMYTIYEVCKVSLLKQDLPTSLGVESEEIKDLKRLKMLAPVLLSFLLYALVEAASSTFFIQQVDNLDGGNHNVYVLVIIQFIGDYVISSFFELFMIIRELPNKIGANIAGAGIICSFICSLVASITEFKRLQLIPMQIFYFIPQFVISGLMNRLAQNGLQDLIRSRLKSETMRNYTQPFASSILGIGKLFNVLWIFSCRRWLKKTVNESRLDKYYLALSCISFVNIFLYYLLVRRFGRVEYLQTEQTNSQVHIEIPPADNADSISNTEIQETKIRFEPETIDANSTDKQDEVRPNTNSDKVRSNINLHHTNSTKPKLIRRRYVAIIIIKTIWQIFFS